MNKFVLSIILGITLAFSCKDQYDFSTDNLSNNNTLNPELAIPLIDAQISIENLLSLNDSLNFLQIGDDKFMTLVYEYDVKQITAFDFFDNTYSGILANINYPIGNETLDLGVKNFPKFDEFYVTAPKIIFTIKNYWDIPASFSFSQFNCYPHNSSIGIPGTGTFFSTAHEINRPTSFGLAEKTEITMDNSNSNIDELVSGIPDHIIVSGSFQTVQGEEYAVPYPSTDSVHIKIELPLDIRVKNLILSDTIKFNASDNLGSDTSKLESLKLNLLFENGFPVDVNTQIYLTDNSYAILDSIFNNEILIPSGQISAGKVTSSFKTTQIINIVGAKKSAFYKASYLIAKYRYNTANSELGETVKIYSNYKIVFKAGALIKLKI
jgi:hypothetical protein